MKFEIFEINSIKVSYLNNQNGGGMHFGQDYIDVIQKRKYNCSKLFEFCSGPAFIGFSLLSLNIVDKLYLSDINPEVKLSVENTIKENNLESKVEIQINEGIDGLKFRDIDLVISNPPHFKNDVDYLKKLNKRIWKDEDWNIHAEFYKNIKTIISTNGIILMQENAAGSNYKDFEGMINQNGLKLTDVFRSEKYNGAREDIYYMEVKIA